MGRSDSKKEDRQLVQDGMEPKVPKVHLESPGGGDDVLKAILPSILFQGRELSLLGLYFATILATALVSHFTEKLIESNGIRLGKRMIARLSVS